MKKTEIRKKKYSMHQLSSCVYHQGNRIPVTAKQSTFLDREMITEIKDLIKRYFSLDHHS